MNTVQPRNSVSAVEGQVVAWGQITSKPTSTWGSADKLQLGFSPC